MKREMSSVVSQVPGFGGEPERPFPIPSAPGISVFDDITWARASGGANFPVCVCVCVCLRCLSVCCQAE